MQKLKDPHYKEDEIITSYKAYQLAHNRMNASSFKFHEGIYKEILENGDVKKLWSEIYWSGRYRECKNQNIPGEVMANYFERLYQPLDIKEKHEMDRLWTDVYMPITDDPITTNEVFQAHNKMKKGWYDFSLPVLNLLTPDMSTILVILFNLILYVAYPIKFAISLFFVIPKKGNLKVLTNYRGIHGQNLLSLLYDRIIASRLIMWAKIHPEQTAFQKRKCTIDQVFLLRIVTALTKTSNTPLYVGSFDVEKAFDKVSRPLLLLSLIKMGLGSTMLHAIKAMYASTKCVIKSGNKLSNIFSTYSGIKHCAPSSVILFIIFMDELIDIMREKYTRENIIGTLHILLHADDTITLSADRSLFIKKCHILMDAFKQKKVSLNMKKIELFGYQPYR